MTQLRIWPEAVADFPVVFDGVCSFASAAGSRYDGEEDPEIESLSSVFACGWQSFRAYAHGRKFDSFHMVYTTMPDGALVTRFTIDLSIGTILSGAFDAGLADRLATLVAAECQEQSVHFDFAGTPRIVDANGAPLAGLDVNLDDVKLPLTLRLADPAGGLTVVLTVVADDRLLAKVMIEPIAFQRRVLPELCAKLSRQRDAAQQDIDRARKRYEEVVAACDRMQAATRAAPVEW